MESEKKNILIVGHGASAEALAIKLKTYGQTGKIFIASGNNIPSESYESVDIREDDLTGLLKFVLENDINLTIPISQQALNSDIVSFFQDNDQNIFGPSKKTCQIAHNRIAGKKFLYKIHAQTSKFGIFDKIQHASEYLKNANFPVIISSPENNHRKVCSTINLANRFITETFSLRGESDILIEEFIYGHSFTVYFITDGYSAVPFATVGNYKFSQDYNSGEYTNGVGCYTPDFRISQNIISKIQNIIQNTISFENKEIRYMGLLGVECTMTGENDFYINEYKTFLQEHDVQAILSTVNDNLINIFESCINGFFSDEYEEINLNDYFATSVTIFASKDKKEIKGIENIEGDINFININYVDKKYFTNSGPVLTVTEKAKTIKRAKEKLKEDLNCINFEGMKYRKIF